MRLDLSFVNYNAVGLHSLIIQPPPFMKRLFFTTPDHEIFEHTAVGFHAHHCDIDLIPLFGHRDIMHWSAVEGDAGYSFQEFSYISTLRDSDLSAQRSFVPTGYSRKLVMTGEKLLEPKRLKAHDIHTMSVAPRRRAAWLALEGEEDPAYQNAVWSARDLGQWKSDGLYQPMSTGFLLAQIEDVLADLGAAAHSEYVERLLLNAGGRRHARPEDCPEG